MKIKTKKKKFNKKYSLIFNKIKNYFAIFFSIQLVLFFFLFTWYLTNPVKNIYSPERIFKLINVKSKNFIGLDFTLIDDYIKVYSTGLYYNLIGHDIDKIELNINQTNIIELEFQRKNRKKILGDDVEIKKRLNKYVNGSLIYNNEKYPIKLRVKGDRRLHFDEILNTSYKVDLRKGKKIWGLEEFSLQKPIIRNYIYEFLFHKLNKELGNISLDYRAVNLSINGLNYGIYSIEEGFTKELLERHAKRDGPIYGVRDDISNTYPNIIYDSYSEMNWVVNDQEILRAGYGILNLIKENNQSFVDHVDWDSWAKFFAVADLMQAYHGALAKSVRVYYNPVTGKIEPISFDGHYGTADFKNFIILDFLKENQNCVWICSEKEWFFRFLLDQEKNPRKEFIEPYIKYLKIISEDKFLKDFKKKYSQEIQELNKLFYSDFSKHDNIFWKGIFPYVYNDNYLNDRAKEIENKIKYFNFSNIIFSKKNNELEIKFSEDSMPMKLVSDCEDLDIYIQTWINKSKKIAWPTNCKKLKIQTISKEMKEYYLYDNPVLERKLPLNFNKLKSINEIVEGDFIDKNFFPKDEIITISESMKLPKNTMLILKENQKIIIKNGSILVLFGDIKIDGSKNKKVTIEGNAPKNGSIISFNNTFEANYLNIKNLSFPNINGYSFFGGMNLINSKVTLNNVIFDNSLSEDALNLVNSSSIIDNLQFKNSKSDALDIDSGNAEIISIGCKDIGNDCLDFSNAKIVLNDFTASNVKDKSISVGEKSLVKIDKIKIINSEIGIAVKDNSDTEIHSMEITKSTLPVAVFVKKNEYGPAKLKIKNLKLTDSNEIFLVDNQSTLNINGLDYFGNESGNVIESYLYGNVYGKATVR